MALAILVILYTYLALATALTNEAWRSQSIYQLLTDRYARTDGSTTACSDLGKYCGGTWQGIINKLDYIQSMGFTAIWISPITEQIQGTTHYGDAFHGFWPQKINEVNANFGTVGDLQALSAALHQRGMYLMIDVVTNDMAWPGSHTTVDYTQFDVFNDPNLYHPFCQVTDYENHTQATECWTGDENLELPDLQTENPTVVGKWQTWITSIISTYNIDGIRLDACLEINKEFFPLFESAAKVYVICEVYNYPITGDNGVCDYQNYVSGLLNFPIWYEINSAFGSVAGSNSSMTNLSQALTSVQANCKDVSLLGNFVENHDVPRFPTITTDSGLDQNAIAFAMMNDGIPIIYSGEEQYYNGGSPPADRETIWTSNYDTTNIYYGLIKKINLFRQCVMAHDTGYVTTKSNPFFIDIQVIALKKGSSPTMQTISVFNNRGVGAEAYTITMTGTGYTAGTQVYEIYTGQTVTVDPDGNLPVYMYGGQPRIYYPLSAQCFGNTTTPQISSTATTATPSITPSSTPPTTVPNTSATSSSVPASSTSSIIPPTSSSIPGSTSGSVTSTAVASVSTPSSQVSSSSTSASSSMSSIPPFSSPSISLTPTAPTSSVAAIASTPSLSSSASVLISSSISPSLPSIPISSAGPNSLSAPLSPIATSSTSTPGPVSGNPLSASPITTYGTPSAAVPGTSSPPSSVSLGGSSIVTSGTPASSVPASVSLSPTVSSSIVPTPATTPPVCPSADGLSFIMNGQEFSVGCGIGSDQEHFAQQPGQSIADCVSKCTTYAGSSACAAVTYTDGVCYLKSEPGAVHQQDGSDSAFVTITSRGQETIVISFLSGNISRATPVCPGANGNTFQSNGFVYVVGCDIDNYVVDIFTSAGGDLATCVESCITYSGGVTCTAVTHNNGNCYLKGSVGTTFHVTGAETAFFIAGPNGVNPAGLPPGPPPQGPLPSLLPPQPIGYPPPSPNGYPPPPPSNGYPPIPTHPTGPYTITSDDSVIVYMPLNETCP